MPADPFSHEPTSNPRVSRAALLSSCLQVLVTTLLAMLCVDTWCARRLFDLRLLSCFCLVACFRRGGSPGRTGVGGRDARARAQHLAHAQPPTALARAAFSSRAVHQVLLRQGPGVLRRRPARARLLAGRLGVSRLHRRLRGPAPAVRQPRHLRRRGIGWLAGEAERQGRLCRAVQGSNMRASSEREPLCPRWCRRRFLSLKQPWRWRRRCLLCSSLASPRL